MSFELNYMEYLNKTDFKDYHIQLICISLGKSHNLNFIFEFHGLSFNVFSIFLTFDGCIYIKQIFKLKG